MELTSLVPDPDSERASKSRALLFLRERADLFSFVWTFVSPGLMLVPFIYLPDSPWLVAFYWGLVWFGISSNNFILHNHVHTPMTCYRWLNRLLDYLLALTTGMTAGNWRLTHLHGHHIERLLQAHPERFADRLIFVHSQVEYDSFRMGGAILHCLRTMGPQWYIPLKVTFKRGFLRSGFRSVYYRYHFYEMVGLHLVTTLLLLLNWRVALSFVILPYILVYFFSRYMDYLTHVGSVSNPRLIANDCHAPSYNLFYFNFGYHTAHHLNPRMHWSMLPQHHQIIAQWLGLENLSIKPYNFTGFLWFLHGYFEHRHR